MHSVASTPFLVCAGIGALLNAIPLPKAIASGNVATSMLIIWTEVACLVHFANAIRWNGNIWNWAPLWCDFCGYFLIAADVALVGSGVSINRHLYMIVTLDPRRREKAFNAIVDIFLCLVIPLVSVALEYVVQQYRYYIFEDIGCVPGVGSVTLSFPLVWMLPLLIGTVLVGYAGHTIRANFQRNYNIMGEPGQSLVWGQRLMALALVSMVYALVPTSLSIALMATAYPVTPWPGWKAIHSTIGDVVYVPAQQWRSNSTQIACLELRRWTIVSLAFAVFIFLGLTSDVRRMYRVPLGCAIGRRFSKSEIMLEQNMGEVSNGHWEGHSDGSCVPVEETLLERRQENLGVANRSRLGPSPETIELALPPAVAHSTSP